MGRGKWGRVLGSSFLVGRWLMVCGEWPESTHPTASHQFPLIAPSGPRP